MIAFKLGRKIIVPLVFNGTMERISLEVLEAETWKMPHVEKLLAIKGVGLIMVAGFLAEVGDVGRFDSPKQIRKLAGLELKEASTKDNPPWEVCCCGRSGRRSGRHSKCKTLPSAYPF